MAQNQKRKHLRHRKLHYTALRVMEDGLLVNDQAFCLLVDLSLGGCRLRCPFPIEEETHVEMDVAFDEEVKTFTGQVRHCGNSHHGGWDVGIEFAQVEGEHRSFLENLLSETASPRIA
jgi:hypothetical protein